ncbi:GD12217 [Drosophila simulans]|uniref:GD12217 n=1 Tax=Drosophila simulans TaxID=7240 RepID=B4QRG9_DROSI|nr:GD12217 [Drosophila simulans]
MLGILILARNHNFTTATTSTTATTAGGIGATSGLFATNGAPGSLGRQANVTEKGERAGGCLSPSAPQPFSHSPPHHPPTIYTQAPQIVRRMPSLMLSPTLDETTTTASSSCFGTGHPSAGSFHQHQHQHHHQQPPGGVSSASGTTTSTTSTHAVPSSKHFQSAGEAAATSSSSTLSPHSATSATLGGGGVGGGGGAGGGGLTSPVGCSTSSGSTVKKKSSFMKRKKPLLTRSEVSSSEFFSVSFCLDSSQQPDEEFIPATKGVTLLNALSHALRRRNLSFTQITITDNNPTPSFLDAGPSLLPVSVDEQTDVESLAGHHLCITERGSNRKPLQKAASFGSRQPPPRLLPSVSTEETSESGVAPGKQIKQRWSSIFGIKNPQQSQLCELLNSYAKNGVPQRADSMNFDHPDLVNSLAYLQGMHKSWRDFVNSDSMSESEVKIQTAIWELVTTEVNNTLLVPGSTTSHSGNMLLSPSHRGISYPPPSPTRVPLRRGMAFSTSTKNPPLRKTRNITSQNSINWHQIPATPTPPSPRSQYQSPGVVCMQKSLPLLLPTSTDEGQGPTQPPPPLQKQLSHQAPLPTSIHNQSSTETDV